MKRRVMVLMGGTSAEREVSLDSGRACGEALRLAGYEAREFDFTGDVMALVAALTPKPAAVFNALHGRWGEDGCMQGLLELLQVPYTHSGVKASALAMDKPIAKRIVAKEGVISPKGLVVSAEELMRGDPMPRPYVVKPTHEGSSVGVTIVHEGDNRPVFDKALWTFGVDLLVEEFIPGRELTVSVMGDRALAVTEIIALAGFYDYGAKYTAGRADHVVPAQIPDGVTRAAMDAALVAHRSLGCRGVSRSDFRYDDTRGAGKSLYYLETNTQPGMTALSLVPEQARYLGMSFADLCAWMVEDASCDR